MPFEVRTLPIRLGIEEVIDCPQESGFSRRDAVAMIPLVKRWSAADRIAPRCRLLSGWLLLLLLLAMEWLAGRAHAAVVVAPRVALVVFSDRTMPEDEWAALASDLRSGFDNLAAETHFDLSGLDVIRGEKLVPGTQFEEVIPVYLHGECKLHAQPALPSVHGALGWVLRDHEAIKPFIHIDCARIAELLTQRAFGLNDSQRNSMMAQAVARVALHEWLHVATQNSTHARNGIFKSTFSAADLVPDYVPGPGQPSRGK